MLKYTRNTRRVTTHVTHTCQVFSSNVVDTAFVQEVLTGSCLENTKTNLKLALQNTSYKNHMQARIQ